MRTTYLPVQKAIHWLVAILVIGALGFGMTIGYYGFQGLVEAYGQETTNLIYKYHKTAGGAILGLMVLRLLAKLRYGKPAYETPLKPWEQTASALTHRGLYVCLFLMPVFGWLGTGAGGFPVEFFDWKLPPLFGKDKDLSELFFTLHGIFGWLTLALAVLHIGGAFKHAIVDADKVMYRMF